MLTHADPCRPHAGPTRGKVLDYIFFMAYDAAPYDNGSVGQ